MHSSDAPVPPYAGEDWFILLAALVKDTDQSKAAKKIGISRPAVCQLMSGKYGADIGRVAEKIRTALAVLTCPHLGQEITLIQCGEYSQRPCPTQSPRESRHWRACQTCPLKPATKGKP